MSMKSLRQRITSMNGINIPDADYLRVPAGEIRAAIAEVAELRRERDRAHRLFDGVGTTHARLATWAREELGSHDQDRFFAVMANGAPDWKTAPRNLAVDLLAVTTERNALAARLEAIERAEPVAWMHADRRMASGWSPRSARAENFVGWSPLIYIPGVAPQPPAAEPVLEIRARMATL